MILTDPNFLHRGEHAYLGYGLWSKRLTESALTPAQLPPVDVIVLSHLHGDHWDRRSRHELSHDLPVVTTRTPRAGCGVGSDSPRQWVCPPGSSIRWPRTDAR
jgi:L-ascorbate metabolism protein UlaG (beta-lactamase superfamily)